MSYSFSCAEVDDLIRSSDELAMLDAELPLTDDTLFSDLTTVRRRLGGLASAAVETIRLRRRAVAKLGRQATSWLFTEEALQQATPLSVATHRARRLAGIDLHDVTCSIGADLAALGNASRVVGSDLDPVRVRMARHNTGLPVVVADALHPVTRGLLPYADPARRASGRRILTADTLPSVAELDRVWSDRPAVLRVPPGLDYERLARPGEVEIVSLDGGVREAVLWPAELATARRRATVLSGDTVAYQLTDASRADSDVRHVGRWLVDPDPAVVRAHLVRQFGFRHGLWQLDPRLAYLSGDERPTVGRAFRVLEQGEFRDRKVMSWLRNQHVSGLEIKVRGLPVDPDALRMRWRKSIRAGGSQRTLILARVGGAPTAFLSGAYPPL